MREIKFRAWHKRYKKMYEVHDLILNSIPNEKNPKVWANCWGKDIIEDKNIILHIEDLDIQQFTGLKDRNGKEIYEGDYLKVDDKDIIEVNYCNGAFKFMECKSMFDMNIGDGFLHVKNSTSNVHRDLLD